MGKEAARISTHALRMEGDYYEAKEVLEHDDFYPRPPHGGRRYTDISSPCAFRISTHALRMEGDPIRYYKRQGSDISTHALRMEGDIYILHPLILSTYFYPRPPHGGRQMEGLTG